MRREKLHIDLPEDILSIKDLFLSHGHKLFVVGGAVRDALLGQTPKDFDLATDALPDKVEKILIGHYKTLGTGKSFGVINVFTDSGEFEIATFRVDIGKGRRPEAVEFTTIENDVKRRDLTINALFYDIERQEVVDLVGGIEDLKNGVIKTVGNPTERFEEDRLRVLRAIRFAARFGSDLDSATADAILADRDLSGVSKERIRDEFLKGIKSAKTVVFFMELLKKYSLFDQIFPGLKICEHFIESRNLPVVLCILFQFELGSEESIRETLKKGTFTNEEVSLTMFLFSFMYNLSVENAFKLKKAESKCKVCRDDLEEIASFKGMDSNMVNAYLKFELTVSGQEVAEDGFKGVELGKEIIRRETEKFRTILEKN